MLLKTHFFNYFILCDKEKFVSDFGLSNDISICVKNPVESVYNKRLFTFSLHQCESNTFLVAVFHYYISYYTFSNFFHQNMTGSTNRKVIISSNLLRAGTNLRGNNKAAKHTAQNTNVL